MTSIVHPNLSAAEEARRMVELRERDERAEDAVRREDREKEKSSWRDETAELLARRGA